MTNIPFKLASSLVIFGILMFTTCNAQETTTVAPLVGFSGCWYDRYVSPSTFVDSYQCRTLCNTPPGDSQTNTNETIHYFTGGTKQCTFGALSIDEGNAGIVNIQFPSTTWWSGDYAVIAIDYSSYAVYQLTSNGNNSPFYAVASKNIDISDEDMTAIKQAIEGAGLSFDDFVDGCPTKAYNSEEELTYNCTGV